MRSICRGGTGRSLPRLTRPIPAPASPQKSETPEPTQPQEQTLLTSRDKSPQSGGGKASRGSMTLPPHFPWEALASHPDLDMEASATKKTKSSQASYASRQEMKRGTQKNCYSKSACHF